MFNKNNGNDHSHEAGCSCDLCGNNSLSSEMDDNSLYLCMDCSQQIDRLEDGIIKESILKFAIGNVC